MADTTTPASRADGGAADRYTVTARKYRPQTFADLVAQEHVAETLRNAITKRRLAHAYLFSGPRGVGKTTAARILAKAVNCETPLSERPGAEPCRTCPSCLAFEEGRSLNIIEIDAASNNRVEDIRELRDTVRIPPQGATKKVYILDEVHMLSASAFNALLKTLEEPPPYALFIFATTEPHKVLPTILSRTQRFDFRRIAVPEIVERLREISQAEGVTADDESLVLLARKGDGALRDALSLYDQALSLCGTDLEIGPLREALGVVDADVYFEATARAQRADRAGLLSLVDHVVRSGHDLTEFVVGLAEHLRNLLVARATGAGDLIEGTEGTRARYLDAAQPYAEADLLHLLMLAETTISDLRESRQPRLTLELSLLKMASLTPAADLGRLIGRLDALEKAARAGTLPASGLASAQAGPEGGEEGSTPRSASGAAPSATAEPSASYSAPEAQAPRPPQAEASKTVSPPVMSQPQGEVPTRPAPAESERSPARQDAQPQPAQRVPEAEAPAARPAHEPPPHTDADAPRDRPSDDDGGLPAPSAPPRPSPTPPASAPAPSRPGGNLFGAPALRRRSGGDGAASNAALAVGGDGQGGAAPAAPSAPADALGPELARVTAAWPAFVDAVRERVGVRVGAIVKASRPLRVGRGAVEIAMEDAFGVKVASDNEKALLAVLADVLGGPAPDLRWVEAPAEAAETAAAPDPFEALKQMRQEHPVVRALFEQFGAEIVWQ